MTDKLLFGLFRLKFSNNEVVRKRLFAELESYNTKLEKLLDSSDKDTQAIRRRTAATREVEGAICGFWVQARNIFKALGATFTCRCDQHAAKLLLQHRIKMSPDLDVIFTSPVSAGWELHRARISHSGEAMAALGRGTRTVFDSSPSIPIRPQPSSHQGSSSSRPVFQRRNEGTITTVQHLRLVQTPRPKRPCYHRHETGNGTARN